MSPKSARHVVSWRKTVEGDYVRQAALGARLLVSGNLGTALQNRRRMRKGSVRVMHRRPLPGFWSEWSPRRINALAKGLRATRYLEIGIQFGYTVENVRVRERVGVDPAPRFDLKRLPRGFSFFTGESDAYFASLARGVTFDLAFLDGLHTFGQTRTDLFNALGHIPSGVILIDDTVPSDAIAALPSLEESLDCRRSVGSDAVVWMGDVWKLVVYIDRCLPLLDFHTIVGSGNPQTLVWRRRLGDVISDPGGDEQAAIASLSYEEFFKNGVPDQFRPCTEAEALRACLAAVTPHRIR